MAFYVPIACVRFARYCANVKPPSFFRTVDWKTLKIETYLRTTLRVFHSPIDKLLKQLFLPSKKQNKVHPSEEQSDGSNFLLDSKLTVTWW